MPDDIFKAHTDDWRAPDDSSAAARIFKAQPRLVPLAAAWLTPLAMLLFAGIAVSISGARLDQANEAGGVWSVMMVAAALTPWIPYGLLPLVQRRHLTHPEPFYRYCRWASIVTATAVPALLIVVWAVGPGNTWGRGAPVILTMVLYCFAMALYPQAARLNHAEWLRAQNAPPPY